MTGTSLLAALALATALSQFHRAALGVVGPELAIDLGDGPGLLGAANAIFFLAIALAQVPVGLALDRIGPRRTVALLTVPAVLGALLLLYRDRAARLERLQAIRQHVFPASLLRKLRDHHPHLDEKDSFLVARALRQYFLIHAQMGPQALIGMPSKVVDDLWHEFILDTRAYAAFCGRAFGHFFHHVPASSTPRGTCGSWE